MIFQRKIFVKLQESYWRFWFFSNFVSIRFWFDYFCEFFFPISWINCEISLKCTQKIIHLFKVPVLNNWICVTTKFISFCFCFDLQYFTLVQYETTLNIHSLFIFVVDNGNEVRRYTSLNEIIFMSLTLFAKSTNFCEMNK